MTFESMIETSPAVVANENPIVQPAVVNEPLAVKVSYADDLRRATFNGVEYVPLRELCAKLFELNPETVILRYQDDDGDKVTMTTDGELQEAISLAKEKKILRVFVDVKAPANPPPAPAEETINADAQPFPQWRRGPFPMRGFPHRGPWMGQGGHPFGGFRGGPFHHAPPHHGPHAHGPHGHGPHGPGPHAHGPHAHGPNAFGPHGHGPHGHGPHGGPHDNVHTEQFQSPVHGGGPFAYYSIPRTYAQGVFTPADAPQHAHPAAFSPYARSAFKMQKHAMKEELKKMKLNAVTDDDHAAIKDFKDQMRSECKAMWQEVKADKKASKSDKNSWKCDKKAWKSDMKAEKALWKEDAKCEKNEKLMARHVADITIPDNSELPADTPVTKTWRLRNAGILAWPADSQLIFVSRRGDNLNGPERVLVGQAVEPNQEVDVSVTFITPSESGRYIGYYRMATSDGTKFGQRVWVSFIVPNKNAVAAPSAPLDPTVPLVPSSPLIVPASPLAAPAKAPEAADDVTMD